MTGIAPRAEFAVRSPDRGEAVSPAVPRGAGRVAAKR